MKQLLRFFAVGMLALLLESLFITIPVGAQILIGPSGSGVRTFNALPTVSEGWSGGMVGTTAGSFTSVAALDNHVMTNASVTLVSTALGSSSTLPPALSAQPRWNSAGLYLQSKPTANDYLLLMASLRNDTGSNITHVMVSYDWDQKAPNPVNENIPGHRAFYSLTGLPGSWTLIPEFSTFTTTSTAQMLSAALSVTIWTNGASLYLLWADDNGPGGTTDPQEGAYSIDNFSVTSIPATTPAVTVQPVPQSVASGGTVIFSGDGFGALPLHFQWRKDGVDIPEATNRLLTISEAQLEDAGDYSLVISNTFGQVVSSNAALVVGCFAGVAINTPPQNQTLFAGTTLQLGVTAAGTQPIGYQWLRNGVPLPGATNASYSRPDIQNADSGLYAVAVSNCLGVVMSSSAVVSVPLPTFTLLGLTNHFWRYEQSNIDLGTAWRAAGYDDSAWPQGRGVFALENFAALNPLTNTVLSLTNNPVAQTPTHYFRTTFIFTNEPSVIALVASNYIDDGAIFYLNGMEAMRFNMPAGAVNHSTMALAANPLGEGVFISSNLPPALLVRGTNTIAVQVHQNSLSSSDVAFGAELRVVFLPPTLLELTGEPADQVVIEGANVVLAAGVSGVAAQYQWFKDGAAIPGATSTTLELSAVYPGQAGSYFLVASNVINVVTSRFALLQVLADETSPRLLAADALDATHVLASFSEPLLESGATNLANFSVTNTFGSAVSIFSVTVTNQTNLLLTVGPMAANANYILTVTDIADVSAQLNILPIAAVPVARLIPLVAFNAAWDYYDPVPPFDEADPGPGWRDPDYNLPFWGQGAGAFRFSIDESLVSSTPVGTALGQTPTHSTFFRHHFLSMGVSPGELQLTLRHAANDGAVFYLNGIELLRDNLPEGLITPSTPATTSRLNMAVLSTREISPMQLRANSNLLAVELHQIIEVDAQKYFAAELMARAESLLIGPLLLLAGPSDATVLENRPVTFRVSSVAASAFQWQVSGSNVFGATNSSFTFPASIDFDGAQVRCVVRQSGTTDFTTNATLHVLPDTTRPVLLSAFARQDGTITLTFTEVLDAASATNAANFVVTNGLAQIITISNLTLVNGSNVVLQAGSLDPGRYGILVNNVRDISAAQNAVASNSAVISSYSGLIIPADTLWRYDATGVDRGASAVWAGRDYDASTWTGEGQGLFAAERGVFPNGSGGNFPAYPEPVRTSVTLSNAAQTAQTVSYYFRTTFTSVSSGSGTLFLRPILDDGAVYYLNGIEIFRLGVANNLSPVYGTLANRTVGDALYEGPFQVPITNLVMGTNVLAALACQVNATSADFAFGLEANLLLAGQSLPVVEGAPVLRLLPSGQQFLLAWDGAGLLESAPTLAGPWETVSLFSPHLVSPTNSAAFFRVRR
jgi:hypothetical protein